MKFEFTQQEANYILNVLANQPYAQVKELVEKMLEQAKGQEVENGGA